MNGDAEVVTFTGDGTTRAGYAEVGERVDRLCRGLQELGVERGTGWRRSPGTPTTTSRPT